MDDASFYNFLLKVHSHIFAVTKPVLDRLFEGAKASARTLVDGGVFGSTSTLSSTATAAQKAIDIDCGWCTSMLPPDYTGPRETVAVSRVQTGPHVFWCEFEERAVGVSGEPGAVR